MLMPSSSDESFSVSNGQASTQSPHLMQLCKNCFSSFAPGGLRSISGEALALSDQTKPPPRAKSATFAPNFKASRLLENPISLTYAL